MPEIDFGNTEDEDSSFSKEEESWFASAAAAKARQEASARAWANVPAGIDPGNAKAQAKRDRENARAAASMTPGSLTGESIDDPFSLPFKVEASRPSATPPIAQTPTVVPAMASAASAPALPAVAVASEISFWKSTLNAGTDKQLDLVTASWEDLKVMLKDYDGHWLATEHKFSNTPANILGFFVPALHPLPANSLRTEFDVIVSNGKVFKAE